MEISVEGGEGRPLLDSERSEVGVRGEVAGGACVLDHRPEQDHVARTGVEDGCDLPSEPGIDLIEGLSRLEWGREDARVS